MSDNTFTPAVFYQDPRTALQWLEAAFGFGISMLIESPDDPRMMHSEMDVAGKGRIMVGGEWAEWTRSPKSQAGANTQSIHVDLETDVDAHCERARAAGAVILQEPENQFYGARTYRARDPEGHVWSFAQFVEDVSHEEAERRSGAKIRAKDWK